MISEVRGKIFPALSFQCLVPDAAKRFLRYAEIGCYDMLRETL